MQQRTDWAERMAEDERIRMVPKRFRVTFASRDGRPFTYHVCTCFDARKALVIAGGVHEDRHPRAEQRVYEVLEVALVEEGSGPHDSDLCDRAEW
jgi:hypothetical protein